MPRCIVTRAESWYCLLLLRPTRDPPGKRGRVGAQRTCRLRSLRWKGQRSYNRSCNNYK
jgi:hypothetical protein